MLGGRGWLYGTSHKNVHVYVCMYTRYKMYCMWMVVAGLVWLIVVSFVWVLVIGLVLMAVVCLCVIGMWLAVVGLVWLTR